GEYSVLITSKVLNEGVNVPEANVGIVLSGSGSNREYTQRLGRLLRKREGKLALLYEVITKGTLEREVAQRRRRTAVPKPDRLPGGERTLWTQGL
ncbi:MAG TPA: ATP-dependent helicase, partial [Armatimonadetes bacterium]|nr:ATP-dependent helicase [Armatimonadota bacterium]